MPPKGATSLAEMPTLTPTTPKSTASATRQTRAQAAAIEIGRQAVAGVVGHRDRLALVGEALDRRDGPEDLFARAGHLWRDIRENGRLVERAAARVALAAGYHARALGHGIGDDAFDIFQRLPVDQRTDLAFALQARPDPQPGGRPRQAPDEVVIDLGVHQKAIGAHAGLAGIAETWTPSRPATASSSRASSNTMNGALPPSSKEIFLTVSAHCAMSFLPTAVDPVNDSLRTVGLPVSSPAHARGSRGRDHVQHARRQLRPIGQRRQGQGRQGRRRGRLDHHSAAGGQGRCAFAHDHAVRKVPRRDRADHADGLAHDQDALVCGQGRHHVAVHPPRLLGVTTPRHCRPW